jgi:hypothetical protein
MQLSTFKNQTPTLYYLTKRAAVYLFILFQISVASAQSTTDSSQPVKAGGPDSMIIRQPDTLATKFVDRVTGMKIKNRQANKNSDSLVAFITDSIRFSEKKPADFSNLPLSWMELLAAEKYFNFSGRPVHIHSEIYEPQSFEGMFYFMVGLLFYFAIVKLFFSKYLANLLTLFFRASMRQQQLREQVLQSPFPSLLLNVLFIFSGGLFGAFLMRFYHFGSDQNLWFHFRYISIFLVILYLLKYLILKVVGWIFNISRAVDFYLFVVFMTNKIIGIFLLPFLVLIVFSGSVLTEIAITLSIIMVCVFYVYRFIGSFATLHKEIKISGLYFILYLCAFEIAPLLLIYKVLVTYLEKAY